MQQSLAGRHSHSENVCLCKLCNHCSSSFATSLSDRFVMASTSHFGNSSGLPHLTEIRANIQKVFGYWTCSWQCLAANWILQKHHVFVDAATEMGKTLSFFIPPFLVPTGIQIIIIALNVLRKQNQDFLLKAGISVISISAKTANAANFQVYTLFSLRSYFDY